MKLVTVAIFPLPQDAYIIRSRLEAEGIVSFLKDEFTVQTDNFLSNAIGGVKLQVSEDDVQKAKDILEEQSIESPSKDQLTADKLMKDQRTVLIVGLSIMFALLIVLFLIGLI